MKIKLLFHYISYLQYPLMLIATFYVLKPLVSDSQPDLENLNMMLVFMGLAISFSTLQDTKKTQNDFSKRIWESPKKGKILLIIFSLFTLYLIGFGLFSLLNTNNEKLSEISFGILVLGIGMVGMLKTMIEMFENHRTDKNLATNEN